jgi:hypothetical protein
MAQLTLEDDGVHVRLDVAAAHFLNALTHIIRIATPIVEVELAKALARAKSPEAPAPARRAR